MAIPDAKGHVTSTGFLSVYHRYLCRVTPQVGGVLEIRSFSITKPWHALQECPHCAHQPNVKHKTNHELNICRPRSHDGCVDQETATPVGREAPYTSELTNHW